MPATESYDDDLKASERTVDLREWEGHDAGSAFDRRATR